MKGDVESAAIILGMFILMSSCTASINQPDQVRLNTDTIYVRILK